MNYLKSFVLALALIAAGASSIQAQSRVTVLAGYSSARVVADPGGETPIAPVYGFVPGVGVTFELSDRVGLTTEALYVPKGYSFVNTEPNTNNAGAEFRLDVRYVELPFLVTARYPFGKAQLIVLGGVTVGVRLHCVASITQRDGSLYSNNCVDPNSGSTVPSVNPALTAGFGFAWHRWTLTGQYEMTGSALQPFPPGRELQHRTLILMLGYDVMKGKNR